MLLVITDRILKWSPSRLPCSWKVLSNIKLSNVMICHVKKVLGKNFQTKQFQVHDLSNWPFQLHANLPWPLVLKLHFDKKFFQVSCINMFINNIIHTPLHLLLLLSMHILLKKLPLTFYHQWLDSCSLRNGLGLFKSRGFRDSLTISRLMIRSGTLRAGKRVKTGKVR